MDIALSLNKAVTVVKTTPYHILLEDLNTQRTVKSNGMVCQCFAKSAPVKGRFKKQPTNLISDERNEPERLFILFQNPRLRIWKVDVTCVLSDLRHKFVCKERMCKGVRVLPD